MNVVVAIQCTNKCCTTQQGKFNSFSKTSSVSFFVYYTLHYVMIYSVLSSGINEPVHDKTNKITCVYSEDSDQPGHPLCA